MFSSVTNLHDAPYSSCYHVDDRIEVTPYENNQEKCLILVNGWVIFTKSCFVKGIIEKKAFEGIKIHYETWMKNFKKRRIIENFLNKD